MRVLEAFSKQLNIESRDNFKSSKHSKEGFSTTLHEAFSILPYTWRRDVGTYFKVGRPTPPPPPPPPLDLNDVNSMSDDIIES